MKQSLVINLINRENSLASAYYHKSRSTLSSLQTTLDIINGIEKEENTRSNDVLKAVRLLESTGAGLTLLDKKEAVRYYPDESFDKTVNKNEGFIYISPMKIEENQWSGGTSITIDIEQKEVLFGVFTYFENETELENILQQSLPEPLHYIAYDPSQLMSFDTFRRFEEEIEPIISDNNDYMATDSEEFEMIGAIQ